MKDNNRSRACMLNHILGTIFRADIMIEIPTEHIPHDDPVMPLQKLNLAWFQLTVRWAEETGLHFAGAMPYVIEIGNVFS